MTTNYHTALPIKSSGQKPLMTGELFNIPIGQLDSALTDILAGNSPFTQLAFGDGGELTIATGAVTVTNSYHNIDTQADAASDDLDTVNGMAVGDICYIRANNTARDVVITHNVGNIKTVTGASIILDDTEKIALLFHNGTNVIAAELGGALGATAGFSGCRVSRTTDFGVGTGGAGTEVTWTQEDYDTDAYFTASSTDIVIPSGFTGKYRVTGACKFPTNATGYREIEILIAGLTVAGQSRNTLSSNPVYMTTVYEGNISAAQAVSMRLSQNSGGSLTMPFGDLYFTLEKLD